MLDTTLDSRLILPCTHDVFVEAQKNPFTELLDRRMRLKVPERPIAFRISRTVLMASTRTLSLPSMIRRSTSPGYVNSSRRSRIGVKVFSSTSTR